MMKTDSEKQAEKIIGHLFKTTERVKIGGRKTALKKRIKEVLEDPTFNVSLQNCPDVVIIGAFLKICNILEDK